MSTVKKDPGADFVHSLSSYENLVWGMKIYKEEDLENLMSVQEP